VTEHRSKDLRRVLPLLVVVALLHLLVAWPGAGSRGIIAEEVQPYLHHYPKLLDVRGDRAEYSPPNDDAELRRAADEGRPVAPRWVGTNQWPEVAYQGSNRVWPVFVRGHQTAIGTYWGIALGPVLGDGIAGVRRANVLMGLGAVFLAWLLGRRLGLSRAWATMAAVGCVLSPSLWFFCRTGYAYELASRVCMLITLVLAAPLERPDRKRIVLIGVAFGTAILCRATIAATLAPALILMLFHPRRWAGLKAPAGILAIGGGLPVGLAALAITTLPFAQGTTPAAALRLGELAGRTLNVPAFLAVQLGFVADARMVLSPLVEGGLQAPLGVVRPLVGLTVTIVAFVRFWQARAGEAERIFLAGLLGNAFVGAWLYGDPSEFQLGMALESLFVLALGQQIDALVRRRRQVGMFVAASLLLARAWTLGSLWRAEIHTNNPMLAGHAQRELLREVQARGVPGDAFITTAYDHVGVLEMWSSEKLRPIHAWRMLMAVGVPQDKLVEQWHRILDTQRGECHVLITRSPSLVAGPFTDHAAVAAALDRTLAARGASVTNRRVINGDGGGAVFELLTVSSCARTGEPRR
jgi:hypothetical protein